ncbi:MAG TPA: acyl-CoA dehydrogenase family protein, partial [Kofleriaceae bacterium]
MADAVTAARNLADQAIAKARQLTNDGQTIDEHQVVVERVAYAATEARVIAELADAPLKDHARVAIAELAQSIAQRLAPVAAILGIDPRIDLDPDLSPEHTEKLGVHAIEHAGRLAWPLDEMMDEVRANVRAFAEREIVPHAERIHHHDELVPERFITEMGKLGYFGLSIPEQYGGHELGNLAMILTTEELSRASLAAAGSLITRPEILAKALLAGGSDEQKQHWLPKLASGEIMAAISVTEPDTGSDVASLTCRAEKVEGGYTITGAKAWCTFAGRADVIAVLARTGDAGARGLTLFIVDKPRFDGHEFEAKQPTGGTLSGKADRTPGYRGMHSFTLSFDTWFVPDAQVVGTPGKGFALQMAGFAAGRLQTGGRACGLTGAALETTAKYVAERKQFGKPIADFQAVQLKLAEMQMKVEAARLLIWRAASNAEDGLPSVLDSSVGKCFANTIAREVTGDALQLMGAYGYSKDFPM